MLDRQLVLGLTSHESGGELQDGEGMDLAGRSERSEGEHKRVPFQR